MADTTEKSESFLSRWSRRKREIEETRPAEEAAPDDTTPIASSEAADMEAEQNRIAAESVDIDSLVEGDDFTMFLKRGVPDLLRKQALRRLWRTNPVFANLDGLNDYDDDFRNPAHSAYTSLWQVGRGFLSAEEQERQQTTGGISRDVAIADAASGEPDAAKDMPEADTESAESVAVGRDEMAATVSHEEDVPVATMIDNDEANDLACEPAPSTDLEETEQPRRRVSIRRRLEG